MSGSSSAQELKEPVSSTSLPPSSPLRQVNVAVGWISLQTRVRGQRRAAGEGGYMRRGGMQSAAAVKAYSTASFAQLPQQPVQPSNTSALVHQPPPFCLPT